MLFIFLATFHIGNAQNLQPKAKLFNSVSNVVPCPVSELEKGFSSFSGKNIRLNFGKNISFNGYVLSNIQRYHNLRSMIIKLPDYNNAILSVSKRVNDDNTITYIGRIINEKYSDGYELKSDLAGNYFLNKIKTEDLIQDRE